MCSSTKFIDFFVHDLLDYTILNNAEANFTKNIDIFDVELAINEIVESLQDKIELK
jgi:hypothetical protein